MERRRRGLYPGGLVYSNNRVIRSHFRRAWDDVAPDPDGLPAGEAFSAVAHDYERAVVGSPANVHMRAIVRDALGGLVRPGDRALDLGAGTGTDALWLADRGATVLAVDVAEGMVREASRRVQAAGIEDRVTVRRMAIEGLRALLPEHARRYDLVLADFGALNLAVEPEVWGPVVARLLKPGGRLVATVMNRWCASELLAGLLRGRTSFALRRVRGDPVRIGGVPVSATLYTPREFARRLRRHFTVRTGAVRPLPSPGPRAPGDGAARSGASAGGPRS